jgi:Spy/CpxP family protein refolding chaperone
MLMKSIAASLAGTALLATVAFAQQPTTTTEKAAPAATTTTASGEWRTSKMDGLKVYNDANENIGSINDLLMDKSGNVKTATTTSSSSSSKWYPDHAVFNASKDELKNMPEFKYSE